MKKFAPISFIKEEIIGSQNTFHAWCVLAAVGAIIGMSFYLSSPNLSFHGVAGSREANVNFEYAVEIKAVHVLPGQRVKKGDLLLELNQSDLDMRIREVNARVAKLRAEKSVRDQMNKAVGNAAGSSSDDPLAIEIHDLEIERAYLNRQRDNLYVFAEIDGIVGSVNFKKGERAQAFSHLVTISPERPTFVQGYIYENLNSNVRVGGRVAVGSITNSANYVRGKIVSVGSRFVQIPERLAPAAKGAVIWGREVVVEIPNTTNLLLGERVIISPTSSLFPSMLAQADGEEVTEKVVDMSPQPIRVPPALSARSRFEASGAVYLPDLKKYLVVSDDTDEKNAPWLFLLSEDGEVEERPMVIPGIPNLQDGESISSDGGYIYVLSSLQEGGNNHKKSGKFLIRTRRSGLDLASAETIDLRATLKALIDSSSDAEVQELRQIGLSELEVESHTVRNGDLYIGLKAPLALDGTSYVLRIPHLNALFSSAKAETSVQVWKKINFASVTREDHRISDIKFVNNTFFFTTTCKRQVCGGFWSLGESDTSPKQIRAFAEDRPEGVGYNQEKNQFFLTFDEGKYGSKYLSFAGPRPGLQ